MRRRCLLSAAAALAGGCLSPAQAGSPGDTDAREELPPTGDGVPLEVDTGDPFERRTVGDPAAGGSHRVVVWNDDVDRRRIRVRIRPVGGDPVVSTAPTFPAYGSFRIVVFRPTDYVLEVDGPEGTSRAFGVRGEFVDCDDSATRVAVRPDGSVRGRVVSTVLPCDAGGDSPPTRPPQ